MSALDVRSLQDHFAAWRESRTPDVEENKAFERYAIEQILKDYDLSDDDIESGLLGGGQDGGVDGFYLFLNGSLVIEPPKPGISVQAIELKLFQITRERSFRDLRVMKLEDFTRHLLDFSDQCERLHTKAKEMIALFRTVFDLVSAQLPEVTVEYFYVTNAESNEAHPDVQSRSRDLLGIVYSQISDSKTDFEFWGAPRLLSAARTPPARTLELKTGTERFQCEDGSVVALIKLSDFREFLTDNAGNIHRWIFESNVRDFQGSTQSVNSAIGESLRKRAPPDFWWLNNGITILAVQCRTNPRSITLERPEIVNGLQTSQMLHAYFREAGASAEDDRHLLVRVIVAPDAVTQSQIIKATNNQTPISPLMLTANDPIQFDIADRLIRFGLYYDRRKGQSRMENRPIAKTVSQRELGRSIIAILLKRPADARARPGNLLNTEDGARQIFDSNYDRNVFAASILIDRLVVKSLQAVTDLTSDARTDLRYYVDLGLASLMIGKTEYGAQELASIAESVASGPEQESIDLGIDLARQVYVAEGGDDKAAKGRNMTPLLVSKLNEYLAAVEQ